MQMTPGVTDSRSKIMLCTLRYTCCSLLGSKKVVTALSNLKNVLFVLENLVSEFSSQVVIFH